MDPEQHLDWSLVQTIHAVAEAGTLSAAARTLGLTQPTLGRQVKAAEARLGLTLFHRHARGLVPTDACLALLGPAEEMRAAALRFARTVEGQEGDPSGTVRITASVYVAHFILPEILAEIRRTLPEVQIELAPSDSTDNLLFREADIALRMYRPEQLEVVTRKVADLHIGLYAAESYIARRGLPEGAETFQSHDLIGYDRSDIIIRAMQAHGLQARRSDFAVRCDDQAAYWQLLRAGAGIGAGQCLVGNRDPGLRRVLPEIALQPLPVWLTAHASLRTVPRIRRVYDALTAQLQQLDRDPANR
ncbi:MAG: LysR family transcriptional regulator [Pseudomonadota bacterium]